MQRLPISRRVRLVSVLSVSGALLSSVGCEIVQSNIPITLEEEDDTAEEDAGGGLPAYPGPACGVASAVLCTLGSLAPDASLGDAGQFDADAPDAALDSSSADGATDIDAATAPDGDAQPGADAGETEADAEATADAAAGNADDPLTEEWCALRCFERCDTGEWECTGTVCGRGEPPPSCEPSE